LEFSEPTFIDFQTCTMMVSQSLGGGILEHLITQAAD